MKEYYAIVEKSNCKCGYKLIDSLGVHIYYDKKWAKRQATLFNSRFDYKKYNVKEVSISIKLKTK